MKIKTKWKHYMFVPENSPPETKGICYGDQGFMELISEFRNGKNPVGYEIHDTKFRPGKEYDGVDWTGFKEALLKHERSIHRKPSVFWCDGRYGESRQDYLRRQMLWSVIRAYGSAGDLAVAILELLATGPEEDLQSFVASIRYRKAMIVIPIPPWRRPQPVWSPEI